MNRHLSAIGVGGHKTAVPSEPTITVAILEDNPKVLEETRQIFDTTPGFRCVHAGLSLEHAAKHVADTDPDVAILDVQFPEGNGLAALAEIRKARPHQRIVMHTIVDSGDEIVLAYLLGASGYILKGDGRTGILDAVRIVADGGAIFSPRIAWTFRQISLGAGPVDWILDLTAAEMEVLDLLTQGLTAKEIGARRDTSVGTINKQCEAIRLKAASRSIRHVVTQVGPWSRILRLLGGLWGPGGSRPSAVG